jgi:aspartate 4-decarboxylase
MLSLGGEALSPFELKDNLIRWARDFSHHKAATHQLLDAGRGNPNWVATTPREAFFLLGQFGLRESKRVWDEPDLPGLPGLSDLGGMPHAEGCADRLRAFLAGAKGRGAELLGRAVDYGVEKLGFDPDDFVHELVDGVVGDDAPVPSRMLEHGETIVQKFLEKVMYAGRPPAGRFDLFAVEGGTAGVCYVFKSLVANRVLKRGDTIALGTPTFRPYLELPALDELSFETVRVEQSEMAGGGRVWQYPDAEIAKLEDPRVKAFLVVNPSVPASVAIRQETLDRIADLVRKKRPDLILLTDDVYGTFVDGFRSLAADLPHNTILVYSFSKAFGCTGWRLGVVSLHERNVVDAAIAKLPEIDRERLDRRYRNLSLEPEKIKFIDRVVADSRDVALAKTAGLSLPQQVQMTLFALFALLDARDEYQTRCRGIIRDRLEALYEGLDMPTGEDPLRAGYYADLDIAAWGRHTFGEEFTRYLEAHPDPLEIVVALAQRHGTVLLTDGGPLEGGSPWTARVSLANLDAKDYTLIGRDLREIADQALKRWREGQTGGDGPGGGSGKEKPKPRPRRHRR